MPTIVPNVTPQTGDAVFIVVGQSNGGFYGNVANTTPSANTLFFNIHDNNFYDCSDPLPGWTIPPGTGTGGSIWSHLGDLYDQSGYKPWNRIIILPAVFYGSSSGSWAPNQPAYNDMLISSYNKMVAKGFDVTAFIWMNGETDAIGVGQNSFPAGEHLNQVEGMLNHLRNVDNIDTPFLIGKCSLCRLEFSTSPSGSPAGPDYDFLPDNQRLPRLGGESQIRNEQHQLAYSPLTNNVYPGADTDLVGGSHRWDNCHLDHYGQYLSAKMWLDLLLRYKQQNII